MKHGSDWEQAKQLEELSCCEEEISEGLESCWSAVQQLCASYNASLQRIHHAQKAKQKGSGSDSGYHIKIRRKRCQLSCLWSLIKPFSSDPKHTFYILQISLLTFVHLWFCGLPPEPSPSTRKSPTALTVQLWTVSKSTSQLLQQPVPSYLQCLHFFHLRMGTGRKICLFLFWFCKADAIHCAINLSFRLIIIKKTLPDGK